MKKSLIITLILFVFSVILISISHSNLNNIKDKVLINETVLYGDKTKADGITITNRTHYDHHLFWDTVYTIGDELNVKTEFKFFQSQKHEKYEQENRIYLYNNLNFGMSSTGGIDLDNQPQFPIKPIKDVASRTKAGKTREETVALRDYYEYYSLILDGSFSDIPVDTMYNGESTDYGSYFKIPVPSNHTIKISITKNEAGEIVEINCNSLENEAEIKTSGIVTDKGIYCAITVNDSSDNRSMQLPDGIAGIHFLPFEELKPGSILRYFDMENANRVYPINNKSSEILNLKKSKDNTKLLMFTKENNEIFLSAIDINTMKLQQKISLQKSINPYLYEVKQYDDFLVAFFEDGEFSLLTNENGKYKIEMSDSFNKYAGIIENHTYYDMILDFDGNRMAAVTYTKPYYDSCSNYVLVYDRTGLAYAGEYSHSLENSNDNLKVIRPLDVNSLSVTCN